MNHEVKLKHFQNPKKEKELERKRKMKEALNNAAEWIVYHKEAIAIAVPITIGCIKGGTKIIGGIARHIDLVKEKDLKERFIYDRSLGVYFELKKPLSSSQMKSILERRDNGEKLSSILRTENLLK